MNKYKRYILILLFFLMIGGIIGITYRPNMGFDFFSYHYYNGWAIWNNRLGFDILPSSFRTFFNPVLDGLNYLILEHLNTHPNIFLFISGLKLGVFLFICYLFADNLFLNKTFEKTLSTVCLIILTLFSPILMHTVGADWTDIQINSMVLIAFLIFIIKMFKPSSFKNLFWLFISGLILGLAVGLKYTAMVFILPFLLCILLNFKNIQNPIKQILYGLIGGIMGFLITDGWWMYKVYQLCQNPIFPYLNNIFHSPYGDFSSIISSDFEHLRPKNITEFLFAPLLNSLNNTIGIECFYFDLKHSVIFITTVIFLIWSKKESFNEKLKQIINPNILRTIIIFIISSYYINQLIFTQYRYIIALIPLGTLIIISMCYVYNYSEKEESCSLNLFNYLLIVLSALAISVFNSKDMLLTYKYIVILAAFAGILNFEKLYKKYKFNKNYCLSLITSIIIFTAIIIPLNVNIIYPVSQVISIKDMRIPDNATVFCATTSTNFIIPAQNPKAKYVIYAMQDEYHKYLKNYEVAARVEYTSKYLQNVMQEIFDTKKDLYIILSSDDFFKAPKELNELYQKSVFDYSGDITNIYKNCKKIKYSVLGHEDFRNDYLLCKLK